MYIIVGVRIRSFRGDRHGLSYWSGSGWGAKGIAKRYSSVEDAERDLHTTRVSSYTWEYPVLDIIPEDKEPQI